MCRALRGFLTSKKCFFKTFFPSNFSKIKIYFTVMLTTSNQKFFKFFSWISSNKVLTEPSKKFNLFLLIVNTLSRHTIFIFSKKNNCLSTTIFLQTFSASLSKLLALHFVFLQHLTTRSNLLVIVSLYFLNSDKLRQSKVLTSKIYHQ